MTRGRRLLLVLVVVPLFEGSERRCLAERETRMVDQGRRTFVPVCFTLTPTPQHGPALMLTVECPANHEILFDALNCRYTRTRAMHASMMSKEHD